MTKTTKSKGRYSARAFERMLSRLRLPRLKRLGGEEGYSLVEVALLVSFFGVPLMLGAIEMGRLAYTGIEISNASRAGAAYASESAATSVDTTNTKAAAVNEAFDVQGLNETQNTFCVCSNAPTTNVTCSTTSTACTGSGNHGISFVQVTTTATVNPVFRFPGLPTTVTLTGVTSMRIGQ